MADDIQEVKKGDVIVRFGIVHKISKINLVDLANGKKDKIIFFQPVFKNRRNETLKLSIPLSNIDKTTIRLPVSKSVLREELKFFRQGEYEPVLFNRLKVKRIISTNDLHEMAVVVKTLWEEKRDEEKNFTISKRNTFKMVVSRFAQEVAFVLGLTLEEAEEKITTALDTGYKRQLKNSNRNLKV